MKLKDVLKTSVVAGLMVTGSLQLAACRADSNGATTLGPNGDGTGPVDEGDGSFPNDGGLGGTDIGGVVTDADGNDIAGGDSDSYFVCTESANKAYGATTEVGANGLIGAGLSELLDLLGADAVTDLLNSVSDADLTIDGDLSTGSTFTLLVSLLGGVIDSLDQSVLLPANQSAGSFAVFALEFPSGILDLSLVKTIDVTTYLNDVEQETVRYSQATLDLLGLSLLGDVYTFVGFKTSKAYDRATVGLSTALLSVDLGDAMKVHELCTGGQIVTP